MMSNLLFALLLLGLPISASNWRQFEDPLAGAREGLIYCEDPDHIAKTCSAFAYYSFADDGSIHGKARGAINNDPPMSFTIETKVMVRNREICMVVNKKDLDGMQLLVGDKIFKSESGDKLIAMVRESLASDLLGKEICEQHLSMEPKG